MAFKKRISTVLDSANKRIPGLTTIDPNLDLGSGLDIAALSTKQSELGASLDAYNSFLAQADDASNKLKGLEKEMKALLSRTLSGVKSRFGGDSTQYELAGGVRTSERKRKPKKTA